MGSLIGPGTELEVLPERLSKIWRLGQLMEMLREVP
jgi:hypothetical protein